MQGQRIHEDAVDCQFVMVVSSNPRPVTACWCRIHGSKDSEKQKIKAEPFLNYFDVKHT